MCGFPLNLFASNAIYYPADLFAGLISAAHLDSLGFHLDPTSIFETKKNIEALVHLVYLEVLVPICYGYG